MAAPVRKMPADWEPEHAPDRDDPFRYGWRPRYVQLPGGRVEEQRIPLTAADLLDPQLGDEILVQGGPHAKLSTSLYELIDRFFEEDSGVLVTFDMKMIWGIPGLPDPSPDIAVIRGVRDKDEVRHVFRVPEEGVRPCLVLEVVSPQYKEIRDNDYEAKKDIYERVGIPEYLIFEPSLDRGGRILLTGHRLGLDGRYRRMEPDGEGRLLSKTTGLLFGVAPDGSILVIDTQTGEPLRKPSQLAELAAREAEARKAAEERAAREASENARLRAELERLRKSAS
jgi:Uma2 family endonuclease